MNRIAISEWLRRNGWESLNIGYLTEDGNHVSVIGHHGATLVSFAIPKHELKQIQLRDGLEACCPLKERMCDDHDCAKVEGSLPRVRQG